MENPDSREPRIIGEPENITEPGAYGDTILHEIQFKIGERRNGDTVVFAVDTPNSPARPGNMFTVPVNVSSPTKEIPAENIRKAMDDIRDKIRAGDCNDALILV